MRTQVSRPIVHGQPWEKRFADASKDAKKHSLTIAPNETGGGLTDTAILIKRKETILAQIDLGDFWTWLGGYEEGRRSKQ
jgi:hypothetical protein